MMEGRSPAGRLHHLAFRAGDLESSLAFYREVFGLEIVRDTRPRSVWLGLSDGAVLMIEARAEGEPLPAAGALDLVAFCAGEEEKRRVRAVALVRGCFDGETDHTVYLRDPDGRRVGVSTYPLEQES